MGGCGCVINTYIGDKRPSTEIVSLLNLPEAARKLAIQVSLADLKQHRKTGTSAICIAYFCHMSTKKARMHHGSCRHLPQLSIPIAGLLHCEQLIGHLERLSSIFSALMSLHLQG